MFTTKLSETHDRISLKVIFASDSDMTIKMSRASLRLNYTRDMSGKVPKQFANFLADYLDPVGIDPDGINVGERFKRIQAFALSCKTRDQFFNDIATIATMKDAAAELRTKAAQMKNAKVIDDLKAAKASGKAGAVMKVLQDNVAKPKVTVHPIIADLKRAMKNAKPSTPVTASKYVYPAGLNEAQKKAFRAKARAAKKA